MTREEILAEVARAHKMPVERIRQVTNTFFSLLGNALAAGDTVEVRRFGTFISKPVQAHEITIAWTGKRHMVPARRKISFRVGKKLAERLWRQDDAPRQD